MDADLDAAQVYARMKERREVEEAYDALQNELRADVTRTRSKESMTAYKFIAFLALHLSAQVLERPKRKNMPQTYSVGDVLTYLSKRQRGRHHPTPTRDGGNQEGDRQTGITDYRKPWALGVHVSICRETF